MENSKSDFSKFSTEYERIMDQLEDFELSGGGKKKEESSGDKDGSVEEVDSKSIQVECVNIEQKRDGLEFSGKICKTPKIRVHLKEDDVPLATIVKVLITYVNKRLRMSNVENVEIVDTKGKKTSYKGDKLGDIVNISTMEDLKEVNIKMN